ncbi:MAG: hypothetical protein C4549_04160 [Deltaproteobacteria bacterium]|jgi:uncharacterized protein (DUF983 family)|nr:MAG: hypothetical protein C4549_04160 [Deltaproteobacteria bacterium]
MSTPKKCPNFYLYHDLDGFICKCPNCGKEKEIFADEFDKEHVCTACGKKIDFTVCSIEGPIPT